VRECMDHRGRRKKTMFHCAIQCAIGGTDRELRTSSMNLQLASPFIARVSFVELSTKDIGFSWL
jgi:hypothetical protein